MSLQGGRVWGPHTSPRDKEMLRGSRGNGLQGLGERRQGNPAASPESQWGELPPRLRATFPAGVPPESEFPDQASGSHPVGSAPWGHAAKPGAGRCRHNQREPTGMYWVLPHICSVGSPTEQVLSQCQQHCRHGAQARGHPSCCVGQSRVTAVNTVPHPGTRVDTSSCTHNHPRHMPAHGRWCHVFTAAPLRHAVASGPSPGELKPSRAEAARRDGRGLLACPLLS